MTMNRRTFFTSLAALGLGATQAAAEAEPFFVNRDDKLKVYWKYRRKAVAYQTTEAPGTIVIDTPNKYLYLVGEGGRAIRYGVGVGKDGFRWSGEATIKRKAKWPKWTPTQEQIQRKPNYKQWASGYPGGAYNPLGARALYLYQGDVDTQYRIHGTTEPESIGKKVSSGCLRMINIDVIDLYDRVDVGTRVIVL